jgi:hypothetical protein
VCRHVPRQIVLGRFPSPLFYQIGFSSVGTCGT